MTIRCKHDLFKQCPIFHSVGWRGLGGYSLMYVELLEFGTCSDFLYSSLQDFSIFFYSHNIFFNHMTKYEILKCISQGKL